MEVRTRVLGVDLGEKRVGLAISDPLQLTAQGLPTLEIEGLKTALERISAIVREKEVGEVVLGLPLNLDGSAGPEAQKAYRFGEELEKRLRLPVKFWDERLSSRQAERVLLQGDVSRRGRRGKIDKLAAQIVLQSYLESTGPDEL